MRPSQNRICVLSECRYDFVIYVYLMSSLILVNILNDSDGFPIEWLLFDDSLPGYHSNKSNYTDLQILSANIHWRSDRPIWSRDFFAKWVTLKYRAESRSVCWWQYSYSWQFLVWLSVWWMWVWIIVHVWWKTHLLNHRNWALESYSDNLFLMKVSTSIFALVPIQYIKSFVSPLSTYFIHGTIFINIFPNMCCEQVDHHRHGFGINFFNIYIFFFFFNFA